MEEVGVGLRVLLLLLLVALDPHLSRLLLRLEHLIQVLDLLRQLLLCYLKLALKGGLLDLYVLVRAFKLDHAPVHVLYLQGPLVQLLILVPDDILESACTLALLGQLQLGLMPYLVRHVQLLYRVLQVPLRCLILLFDLVMLDAERAMPQVQVLMLDFELPELGLELVDALLALLLDLSEPNDLSLALLKLEVDLVDLGDECAALLLVDFLEVLGLFELQEQVLLLVLQASDLRLVHV